MDWSDKINLPKQIKILSLTAVLLIALFLILVFYSEIQKIDNFSLAASRQRGEEKTPHLRLLFFGDLMLDRHIGEKIKEKGFPYLLENLDEKKFFHGYDLIGCNLEGAVTDKGAHYNPAISYDFAFAPEIISNLKKYNFNFFNLANNHFADQGERGIIETRKNLDNLGFYYSGCPDGQIDVCSEKIIEIKGKKIGMAGFSMVYQKIDEAKAARMIRELAETTDLVIVNIHWGQEYEHQFNKIQQETARALIDAGADVIIGHHPHVVQGLEVYKNKPIFYCLGNFIFDQYFSRETQEGLAIGITLAGNKIEINLFPNYSEFSQAQLMAGERKNIFLSWLADNSKADDNLKKEIKAGKIELIKTE